MYRTRSSYANDALAFDRFYLLLGACYKCIGSALIISETVASLVFLFGATWARLVHRWHLNEARKRLIYHELLVKLELRYHLFHV